TPWQRRPLSNRMLKRSSLRGATSPPIGDSGASLAPRTADRMQAVQTPVIPVVGDLVRSTPGAISLGQGVVYYGPPPEALAAARQFGANPQDHKYHAVGGIAPLVDLISDKVVRENSTDLKGRSIVVTAGANMAFFNAVLAVADVGD